MIVQIYKRNTKELLDTLYGIKKIWESCERIYFENDEGMLCNFNAKEIEFHVIF